MRLIGELWSVLDRRQRRRVIAAQLLSLAMAVATVVSVAAIAPFFAVLGDARATGSDRALAWLYAHGGFSGRPQLLETLGIAFVVAVVGANLLNACGFAALHRLAFSIGDELRVRLFGEYLSRPYVFHARAQSAVLCGRVIDETERLSTGILLSGFLLVAHLATGSLIVASIVLLDPLLAVTILLALAGGYAAVYALVRRRLLRDGARRSRAWTDQARIIGETFGAMREVALLPDTGLFRAELAHASRRISQATARIVAIAQAPRHIMESVAACALVAAVAATDFGAASGSGAWLGHVSFVSFAAYRLLPALQQMFASIVRIRADRAGFALIAPDLRAALAKQAAAPPRRAHVPAAPVPSRGVELRLREVSFRYESGRPLAIAGISLRIAPGAIVGLAGANGSGKTTLMDLVAGLLAPTSGTVEIDGVALDERARALWRTRVAYVPQSIVLLDRSIEENIALGVPPDSIDRRRVREAGRLAQLDELVGTLPAGYAQRIGERGALLSGGQRQRIGIARALYRDSAILLLDEPANALDRASELELAAMLERLRGTRTILVSSHRLATLRPCEAIHRLDVGRLMPHAAALS